MMSSSDFSDYNGNTEGEWEPLVSHSLEKFSSETPIDGREENPEVAKVFEKLYRKGDDEQYRFSLLYDPALPDPVPPDPVPPDPVPADPDPGPGEFSATEPEEVMAGGPVAPMPDVENIERRAYEEGYEKGEARGYEEGLRKAGEKVGQVETLLFKLESLWDDLVRLHEEQIIDLVGKVAEKVVLARVELDDEMVRRTIMAAFELIPDPTDAVITVNPDDYEFIEIIKDDFFQKIRGLKQVSIVSDPSVRAGDCVIGTVSGEVATGVEKRLEAVKQSLRNALGQGI